jgi:hypothetical protein
LNKTSRGTCGWNPRVGMHGHAAFGSSRISGRLRTLYAAEAIEKPYRGAGQGNRISKERQ